MSTEVSLVTCHRQLASPDVWSVVRCERPGARELYIRRLFFAPPARPNDYDMKCKRAVRAEVGRCRFTPG